MKRMLVTVALFAALLTFCGCAMTAGQREAVDTYTEVIGDMAAEAAELGNTLLELKDEVIAVKTAIDEERIPLAEGARLLDGLNEKQDDIEARVETIETKIPEVKLALADMKAAEVPWWRYALATVLGVLGTAGMVSPKLRGAANAARMVNAMITGVETANDAKTKSAITSAAGIAGIGKSMLSAVEALYPKHKNAA